MTLHPDAIMELNDLKSAIAYTHEELAHSPESQLAKKMLRRLSQAARTGNGSEIAA